MIYEYGIKYIFRENGEHQEKRGDSIVRLSKPLSNGWYIEDAEDIIKKNINADFCMIVEWALIKKEG